ncbi:hypothetical protein SB775_26410 [Peribacillus sp. SIMBA_075]|uniref:hypothetical protein n=1 Tax=Peribacillus sp. SIMBA_075 TaxID=3085813 RepID=UPI003978ACC6
MITATMTRIPATATTFNYSFLYLLYEWDTVRQIFVFTLYIHRQVKIPIILIPFW